MLGLVNQALQEMVTDRLGAEAWDRIRQQAGVQDRVFVVMRQYPDQVTYDLAGAVAAQLGVPLPDALHAFGHYWMAFAERQPWGKVMHSMGGSVRQLLPALDALHARIALAFPGVRMPHFRTEDRPDGSIRVTYVSERAGLAPFVLGVLEGIGAMYGEMIEVRQVEDRAAGAEHDVFLVTFPAAAG
jgi:hypothetical protein